MARGRRGIPPGDDLRTVDTGHTAHVLQAAGGNRWLADAIDHVTNQNEGGYNPVDKDLLPCLFGVTATSRALFLIRRAEARGETLEPVAALQAAEREMRELAGLLHRPGRSGRSTMQLHGNLSGTARESAIERLIAFRNDAIDWQVERYLRDGHFDRLPPELHGAMSEISYHRGPASAMWIMADSLRTNGLLRESDFTAEQWQILQAQDPLVDKSLSNPFHYFEEPQLIEFLAATDDPRSRAVRISRTTTPRHYSASDSATARSHYETAMEYWRRYEPIINGTPGTTGLRDRLLRLMNEHFGEVSYIQELGAFDRDAAARTIITELAIAKLHHHLEHYYAVPEQRTRNHEGFLVRTADLLRHADRMSNDEQERDRPYYIDRARDLFTQVVARERATDITPYIVTPVSQTLSPEIEIEEPLINNGEEANMELVEEEGGGGPVILAPIDTSTTLPRHN